MGLLPGQIAQTSCRLGVLRLDAGRLNAFPVLGDTVHVTQVAAEVFTAAPAAARATQLALEVFRTTSAPSYVTQVALELFLPQPQPARVTQSVLEVFRATPASLRISQAIVEVFLTAPGGPLPIEPPCYPVEDNGEGGSCSPPLFDPDSDDTWT